MIQLNPHKKLWRNTTAILLTRKLRLRKAKKVPNFIPREGKNQGVTLDLADLKVLFIHYTSGGQLCSID